MNKSTFKIIYNLDGLDDAAIEKYSADVAAYFELNPGINWFDVLWMTDPDTGFRRRQLYARRGTTDILRDKRKISLLSMTQHDGPGYVSFTATGKDPSGRQEIAVGAHSTEGLKGEKLAAAVSTAETRAGRRLTLKFCGLGILDYTEVTDPVDVKTSPADLATVAPAPMFSPSIPTPNTAPGKMVDQKERAAADSLAQASAEADAISKAALAEAVKQGIASLASVPQPPKSAVVYVDPKTVADVLNAPYSLQPATGLHKYAESMATITRGDGLVIPVPLGASTVVDSAPLPAEAPIAPKQRRTRKKNTVDISAPGQVSTNAEKSPNADIPQSQPSPTQAIPAVPTQAVPAVPTQANPAVPTQANGVSTVTAPVAPGGMTMTLPTSGPHQPILAPSLPAPPTNFPGQPSKEQEAQYREKLREYSNAILPGAGMVPSQGIGGPSAKLRMYAERMAGKSTQQMTTDDWDDFFNGMADFRSRNGDKGLVKYINDVIGAK